MAEFQGNIEKMTALLPEAGGAVEYALPIGGDSVGLNGFLGEEVRLEFLGEINCIHCGRKTNKSFNQGYCFPCMKKLAECDQCIVRPELCHFHLDTCRDPEWAEHHCFMPHTVYLANSSGLKVGITRNTQIPTRWIDQGASQAIPVFHVDTRHQSGLVEDALKAFVTDKTDWRKMLKGVPDPLDMRAERERILEEAGEVINRLRGAYGDEAVGALLAEEPVSIEYPVSVYPEKVNSLNLDKDPVIESRLQGIKGQYLIFEAGVINLRKYGGYQLKLVA
ncbi:MAG: DUF2797 domain-containing protein [Gammaproteobacteria bacterium]